MDIKKKYLLGITIASIIYLTLIPEKMYYKINKLINYYPIRFIIISLIAIIGCYDMGVALLLTLCYVITLYSCINNDIYELPSSVLPYLILKNGEQKYINDTIDNDIHKFNKNTNNCYNECVETEKLTDNLKITCNAACDIDNKFTSSPKNLEELENNGVVNPKQTMLNIGCNRIDGKEKTVWKDGECTKF